MKTDGDRQRPPRSCAELRKMIASREVVLPSQLEHVARMALERPHLIAFGTVKSIASLSSVSSTTVVRLAHCLGFSSFRELKNLFRDHLRQSAGYSSV